MRLSPLLLAFAAISPGHAAELPLGVIEQADAQQVVIHFDAGVHLQPGSMLAVYGPGRVEKHPLTKEVIIEARKLLAKAQVVGGESEHLRARLVWGSGALEAGMDVVPLPGEAAPNARPAVTAALSDITAPVEGSVRIQLPIADPDGDSLTFSWSVASVSGRSGEGGVLSARTTSVPELLWTAPGAAGVSTLTVTARDPLGQTTTATVKLTALAADDWRKRELKNFAKLGVERQPAASRLTRDADGSWWLLDEANVTLHQIVPGWINGSAFPFAADKAPRRPVAALTWHKDLYVLDAKKCAVLVYGADGNPKREFGQCVSPSDMRISPEGTLFIADQGAGGVLVYETSGKFRARLGRAGQGDDAFTGLTRIALGAGGELYCLDASQNQIQRFDRNQRRLETWNVQADSKNPAVDLAAHPKGMLVLLASGQIRLLTAAGQASNSWKGLPDAQLVERTGNAGSLFVDASDEVFVTYPEYGYIARYGADGVISGVRGAALWEFPKFTADGQGRLFALDTDYGHLMEFDAEGWRIAKFGGLVKNGGPFTKPVAIAASLAGDALAVIDASAQNVVRINLANLKEKPLVFGQPGRNNGQFLQPLELVVDGEGRIYVLDGKQHRVQVFDAKGVFLYAFGHYEKGKQPDELIEPTHLAVSPAGDAAYIYDYDTYEIRKFALDPGKSQGVHVNNAGGKGDGPGQFRYVQGLACDRAGLLYAIDSSRGDLQVLDFRGNNAVPVVARKAAELGVRKLDSLTLAPDGQIYLINGGSLAGWRW